MQKLVKTLQYVSGIGLFLFAFLLGITWLKEPDLWWIIESGKHIVTHLEIPTTDVFSFTYFGLAWTNVKWLFEVIAYGWASIFGIDLLVLIQAFANIFMVIALLFWYKTITKNNKLFTPEIIIVVAMALACMSFRMTARPELISHVFAITSLLLWQKLRNGHQASFYLLIILQMFWVNLHEAYPVGLVINGAMALGFWLEYKFIHVNNPIKSLNLKALLVPIISYLACAIHPLHVKMLAQPFEIFSQLEKNKYTNELFDITTSFYWETYQVYMAIAFVSIVIIGVILNFRKGIKTLIFNSGGVGNWLVALLFIYLATTAHRNLPFLFIGLTPLVSYFIAPIFKVAKLELIGWSLATILVISFYIFTASNKLYQLQGNKEFFGLGVSALLHPVGAANYIKHNNLSGNCFSDFLVSSYLLYQLSPNFKTFIDFRDLDVFDATFFDAFLYATIKPERFELLDKQYQFNYAVLYQKQFENLHRYFHQNQNWKVVYADEVAAVYQKTDDVSSDNSRLPLPIFTSNQSIYQSKSAAIITKLLWPFESFSKIETNPIEAEANYYLTIGEYSLAEETLKKAINADDKNELYPLLLAQVYFEAGKLAQGNQKANLFNKSATVYMQILQHIENHEKALFGLGYLYYQAGNAVDAQSTLLKLVKNNPNHLNAYIILADCQNLFMNADPNNVAGYTKKWFEYMHKAYNIDPNNQLTQYKLGVSYCQRNNCKEAVKFLKNLQSLPELSTNENNMIKTCKKKCL